MLRGKAFFVIEWKQSNDSIDEKNVLIFKVKKSNLRITEHLDFCHVTVTFLKGSVEQKRKSFILIFVCSQC